MKIKPLQRLLSLISPCTGTADCAAYSWRSKERSQPDLGPVPLSGTRVPPQVPKGGPGPAGRDFTMDLSNQHLACSCRAHPACWAQRGSKFQTQRICTPACTFCVEKARPGFLSQPLRAAHRPCPSAAWHPASFSTQLTRSSQTPSSHSPPAAASNRSHPKNAPGRAAPAPAAGSRWEPGGHQPSLLSPGWQSSSLAMARAGQQLQAPPGSPRLPRDSSSAQQLLFCSCHVILPWVYFKRCV